MPTKNTRVTIMFPKELEEALRAREKKLGLSFNKVVRDLLEKGIEADAKVEKIG